MTPTAQKLTNFPRLERRALQRRASHPTARQAAPFYRRPTAIRYSSASAAARKEALESRVGDGRYCGRVTQRVALMAARRRGAEALIRRDLFIDCMPLNTTTVGLRIRRMFRVGRAVSSWGSPIRKNKS